jgi:hypothetical protein
MHLSCNCQLPLFHAARNYFVDHVEYNILNARMPSYERANKSTPVSAGVGYEQRMPSHTSSRTLEVLLEPLPP